MLFYFIYIYIYIYIFFFFTTENHCGCLACEQIFMAHSGVPNVGLPVHAVLEGKVGI